MQIVNKKSWFFRLPGLLLGVWIFTLFFPINLQAQTHYSIGIFHQQSIKMLMITPHEGEYKIKSADSLVYTLRTNDIVNISISDGFLQLRGIDSFLGAFQELSIEGHLSKNSLRVKLVIPGKDARIYPDNMRVFAKEKSIQLVNRVGAQAYIAGVVESEGGPSAPFEYYKAQALLCRTYAQGHLHKHREEGFQLCDGVHCQAYHGKATHNDLIPLAVEETGSEVIIDDSGKLITAAYHSNCGGQTVNSEHVWVQALPYLQSIDEHYCLSSPNARWEKEVSLSEWVEYLGQHGIDPSQEWSKENLAFVQKERRQFYVVADDSLELKKLRSDWKLKSTYFSVIPVEEILFIDGKGYGHGVGMCQEGAMSMARNAYDYREIIHHYYQGVKIVSRP